MASSSAASAISLSSPPLTFSKKSLALSKLQPATLSLRKSSRNSTFKARASDESVREKVVSVATAAALAAALVVPEIADAAGPGISPSLKNFLLSIVSGGVVLTAIVGAVVGVSNFDPVKRG